MSVEELLENRRRGMSYASIGRKLGIDPSKDECSMFIVLLNGGERVPNGTPTCGTNASYRHT